MPRYYVIQFCPDLHVLDPKTIPCDSKGYPLAQTAAADLDPTG